MSLLFDMRTPQWCPQAIKKGGEEMSGKYMKVKRIMIPMITMVCIASQLMGCAAVSQNELLGMLERGREIEIEVAVPINEEQGEENALIWEQLALLETAPEIRSSWEDILGITGSGLTKNGVLYINSSGEQDPNNTLQTALHNRAFLQFLEDESSLQTLAETVESNYVDIEAGEEEKAIYMGINAYFNLLPDAEPAYANPDSTLSRGEFMTMVMRSETPVSGEIKLDSSFTNAVGSSQYNFYAQQVAKDSYLTIEDKSLNNMTYNGTITRAEAIYTLMNHYFSEELKAVDVSSTASTTLTDVKDGGDIASKQSFDKEREYWKSYELVYATQNPTEGIPTDLYKALILANQKGIISSETRWDEGITKSEAIGILIETLKLDQSMLVFNASNGITAIVENDTQGTVEQETTVNPEAQEIADYVNNMDMETESEPAEDIPAVDAVHGTTPQPTEPETTTPEIQENTSPSNSNTSTSNVLRPLTEEEKAEALKEVVSDIPEAVSVDNYTVTDMAQSQTMYVIDGGYIREAPSTDANVIRAFWGDEKTINVYGKVNEGDWYKVFVPMRNGENTYGYVSGTLLSKTDPNFDESKLLSQDFDTSTGINPLTGEQFKVGDTWYTQYQDGSIVQGSYIGDTSNMFK